MDVSDSKSVKNYIKLRSIITALFIHIILAVLTVGISLIIFLFTAITTVMICRKEVNKVSSDSTKFNKTFPFRYFGKEFGEFQHVFYHGDELEKKLYDAIESALTTKTPIQSLETVTIKDVDKDLASPDDRVFFKAETDSTDRGTSITLIINQSSYGSMRSIQWRVLAGGYIDRDKRFSLVAYSIFTLFYWIIPYLKNEYDLLNKIRTIYTSSYNSMEIGTHIRCLHEAIFDAMIEELEKNGVDTSDLKAQKMQVMNINVSGGKVSMGNVVQGAMNKVTSVAKGQNT